MKISFVQSYQGPVIIHSSFCLVIFTIITTIALEECFCIFGGNGILLFIGFDLSISHILCQISLLSLCGEPLLLLLDHGIFR